MYSTADRVCIAAMLTWITCCVTDIQIDVWKLQRAIDNKPNIINVITTNSLECTVEDMKSFKTCPPITNQSFNKE